MASALSQVPAVELIALGASPECNVDARYEADWELIKRFRAGVDLPHLIALMQSDSISGRSRAAFFVEEVASAHEALREAVVGLADDPLADCRRAFVKFVTETRIYDAKIAGALARCLHDTEPTVRLFAILWAIHAPTGSFDPFCTLGKSGAGLAEPTPRTSNRQLLEIWQAETIRRSARALDIARRARLGETIRGIGAVITGEDSLVLFGLERLLRSTRERRRIPSAPPPATG